MIHILKIKGTTKIPDFVQIRDQEMTLIAYFRLTQIKKGLIKNGLEDHEEAITQIINNSPFGIIQKYNAKNK